MGRRSLSVTTDVTSRESLQSLLGACLAEFSSVEILLNCAGRTKRTPTLEVSDSEWAEILETNLTGTLRSCQVFGRHMDIEAGADEETEDADAVGDLFDSASGAA